MEKNVPKLRFKEFTKDWVASSLEKVGEINPNNREIPDLFRYIDLGVVQSGNLIGIPAILTKEMAPSRAQRLLMKDDIIFQTVRPYQSNNYLFDTEMDYPVVASTGYAQIRVNESYNKFVYQLLHSPKFTDEVMIRCTGTSYPAINSKGLSEISIRVPSFNEQLKIGDFLFTIDTRITLQSLKVSTLTELKKGIMKKIFSQEIRFKREDGEEYPKWETRLIYSVVNRIIDKRGLTPKKLNMSWGKGNIKALSANNVKMGKIDFELESYLASESLYDKWMKDEDLEQGDVLMTMEAPLGNIAQVPDENKYILSQRVVAFKVNTEIITKNFFAYYLMSPDMQMNLMKNATGTTALGINQRSLSKLTITHPVLEEQHKIADFLSTLDSKIDIETQILSTLQTLKKGLLQQMFV